MSDPASFKSVEALCLACGRTSVNGFGAIRHKFGCIFASKKKRHG